MNTIGERIKLIRKSENINLTLEKFGEHLGVGKSTISQIESGRSNVTDQMFKSICREFDVNPGWLENGEGDMFIKLDKKAEIAGWVGRVLKNREDSIQLRLINAMMQWTDEDWKWVDKQIEILSRDIEKERE